MQTAAVLPVLLFVACVLVLAIAMLLLAAILNPKRPNAVKRMPYESGMDPVHDTRRRFDVRFYLMAIAFLVFDVELLFLYPWAVAMRPAPLPGSAAGEAVERISTGGISTAVAVGWASSRDQVFIGAMVFLILLALGFLYDWRKGIFRWR